MAMRKFIKFLRGHVKFALPLFFMRRWMLEEYGVEIEKPLSWYAHKGLWARLKMGIVFMLPVSFDEAAVARIKSMEYKPEEKHRSFDSVSHVEILCTKHTIFVARLVAHALNNVGITSVIRTGVPKRFMGCFYFVICPQMFNRLPATYVAFQMEQTVSSRWLTSEYYMRLNAAITFFDYSLVNMEYWERNSIPLWKRYYLPIDYLKGMKAPQGDYSYDVLFYGDPHNERRMSILGSLQQEFKVKILSEVYEDELYYELAKAKIVINIHYYENAMLETTRIYETLSLARSIVISETSCDKMEEERLRGIVDFVPMGDVNALKERIQYWLEDDSRRIEAVSRNNQLLESRANAFEFYFNRYLLAWGFIDFDRFYALSGNYVNLAGDRFCLSLPETVSRTKEFDRENRFGFIKVVGLRHRRGWTGCGLSYKFIMRRAAELGIQQLTVCEDDVGFPGDYEQRLETVEKYLAGIKRWDVFQGMMADIGAGSVRNIDKCGDEVFVHLDHMISTVYNIYRHSVFGLFDRWDPDDDNAETNTIDRALNQDGLDVVTTSPFLITHKEDLDSSLWGKSNGDLYGGCIAKSKRKLDLLISEFIKSRKERSNGDE